jgi:hypothetical protein
MGEGATWNLVANGSVARGCKQLMRIAYCVLREANPETVYFMRDGF